MDKKLKAKWVKALRSGKFKQGREDYFDPKTGGYCCLGVLDCVDQGMPSEEFLPNWGDSEDKAGPSEKLQKLIKMNDDKGKSFKWIAAYIERYL